MASEQMLLTHEEVEHVALLARLQLEPAQVEQYRETLNRILGHFLQLNELDTEGVEPTSHPAPVLNVLRKDETRPSLPVEEALANAPDQEMNCFKTPVIIQET